MQETVFVATGVNNLTMSCGTVGVARTKEGAETIAKEHEDTLDATFIFEYELQD